MSNNYLDALKSKKLNDVKMSSSPTRQALVDQKGICAKCKKRINPAYSKFLKDPTGKMTVICSDCAVSIAKR